jgi:predicted amidohydrolase
MRDIRVAATQFQHAAGDKAYNLGVMRRFAEQAAAEKVEILAFPECCISGYWHLRKLSREELWDLAEPVFEGPSSQTLRGWSRELGITIGAGLVERTSDGRMYNTYVVAMPNGELFRHRKIQAFEHDDITPGDSYTVFDTPHGCRVGVLICYDNNLVENARATALLGAEILLAPHQTGGCRSGSPHGMKVIDRAVWENRKHDPWGIEAAIRGENGRGWLMRWLPSRAHDNGLFYVFSNGVGPDDDEVRTGNAMVIGCYGRILNETWKAGDDLVIADLDASLRERCTGVRWMRARRPELYGLLTQSTGQERSTREVRFEYDETVRPAESARPAHS